MNETVEILELSGQGDSEEQALQEIFQKIQPALSKDKGELLLRVEPQKFEIIDAVKRRYTEKFLGILFPRKREQYEITAKITVRVRKFATENIIYRMEEEKLSVAKHILEMR